MRPMTYAEATDRIAKKSKLENNTRLVAVAPDTYSVRLHATDVVKIHPDGSYTLNSGGWRTKTTKERINNYSPATIQQTCNIWHIGDTLFVDGMTVDSAGKPNGPDRSVEGLAGKIRHWQRKVADYVQAYADHVLSAGGLPYTLTLPTDQPDYPSSQALFCLECIKNKRYPSNVLWDAVKRDSKAWRSLSEDAKRGDVRSLKRYLKGYFKELKVVVWGLVE